MATEIDNKEYSNSFSSEGEENFSLENIPTDYIIEYDIRTFPLKRKVYAKRQIETYRRKIDNLKRYNRPDLKPVYIFEINKLILKEKGVIEE